MRWFVKHVYKTYLFEKDIIKIDMVPLGCYDELCKLMTSFDGYRNFHNCNNKIIRQCIIENSITIYNKTFKLV